MSELIRYVPGDEVSRALADSDPAMGALIERVGGVEFDPGAQADRFSMLVRGVVGQQVSGAAAESIFARLRDAVGMTPKAIAEASHEGLLAVGLSGRKAEYVCGLAHSVLSGELDLDGFDSLPDDEIAEQLTRIRGIGPWTAHMFLLFALRRPDVIAPGDLGIRQAVGHLLDLGREATPAEVEAAAERWRPYRSAATFYLYREAGMGREAVSAGSSEAKARDEAR